MKQSEWALDWHSVCVKICISPQGQHGCAFQFHILARLLRSEAADEIILQDMFNLLRPNLQRFESLEEAYAAAAALEAQEAGGLEPIEEMPSDDEEGESGSDSEHDGRGGQQSLQIRG